MVVVSAARRRAKFGVLCVAAVGAAAMLTGAAAAQTEPASCLSMNPQDWPAAAKPYFLLAVDTSGSMTSCTLGGTNPTQCNDNATATTCTSQTNSCGMPKSRINDAKCALRQSITAFGGQVNFGLLGFAGILSNCPAAGSCTPCPPGVRCDCMGQGTGTPETGFVDFDDNGDTLGCRLDPLPGATAATSGSTVVTLGCGNTPTSCSSGGVFSTGTLLPAGFRNGGSVLVPLLQDPSTTSNVPELLEWFDGSCANNRELWANGDTPLEGILNTTLHYITYGWDSRWGTTTYCANRPPSGFAAGSYPQYAPGIPGLAAGAPTPACRSLNVILVTDGDEGCNGNGVTAASRLFDIGVRTHVISVQASNNTVNDIADEGDDGTQNNSRDALTGDDDLEMASALSAIIGSAIRPETCNNLDDNCNGCTDEGFKHYCNRSRTPAAAPTAMTQCCQWSNTTQRNACLTAFQGSISAANPKGNQWLLPCWDPATDATAPQTKWLCNDPGEHCDNNDNNCDVAVSANQPGGNTADETINKCGNPPLCPAAEICDGRDNDCDNVVDDGVCGGCNVTPEICDGCDNDCNGIADDNVPPVTCGQATPANCAGQRACVPRGAVTPGGCVGGGGNFGACSNNPGTEVCNSVDDDCNGVTDEGIPPVACEVPGQPGLVYDDTFPQSFCKRGTQPCNGTCTGYRGPRTELCNGIDDDCDGVVDNNLTGFGGGCSAQCGQGTYVCEGGVPFCRGIVAPQPELCDGLDNDCNGVVDDGDSITDVPPTLGCWTNPDPGGTCGCNWRNANWCPPANATCTGTGSLTAPCHIGTLICAGVAGWRCTNDQVPAQEVCDGSDNDCNGTTDDGIATTTCGPTTTNPPCRPGTQVCQAGVLVCDGAVFPGTELCNGMDDDCDTQIDEGVPVGDSCEATYDMTLYPGPRNGVLCKPGTLICDPAGTGALLCDGGVGPQPEVCDGLDNDCDGQVDEAGPPPDGIDGTADPDDPSLIIGATCGVTSGVCTPGQLACIDGDVRCTGGVGTQPEVCDCQDNDCDGLIDEDAEPGENPICGTGRTCVEVNAALCACAGPCASDEFPCPIGTECRTTNRSASDQTGNYCVSDPCGDCSTKTAQDQNGAIVCAPASSGLDVPECVCKGNAGCANPCSGVSCPAGESCVLSGPEAGRCHDSGNCLFHGCPIAGQVCAGTTCVDNPCGPDSCPAGEVCKPNATFDGVRCVGSCAGVRCSTTERCVEGMCQPTGCDMACPAGQLCVADGDGGFSCGPSKCPEPLCSDGRSCDPATGQCNQPPCNGVLCPMAQSCSDGECDWTPEGGAGTGGTGGDGGAAGAETGGGGPTAGTGGGPRPPDPRGVWGLATGGGGCSCRTVPARPAPARLALLIGLGASALMLRRRRVLAAARRGAA